MGERSELELPGGPLEVLFERGDALPLELPRELAGTYAGTLGIARPRLFANFVSSVEGTVAFDGAGESGHVISGNSEADRFVMGLLRACADTVLIGASTLRASPTHLWTPARIFPPAAAHFAELRRTLGLAPEPKLVVVTASGDLDPSWPALGDAMVATTRAGAARWKRTLPDARVIALDDGPSEGTQEVLRLAPLVERLRSEGTGRVLTEGGPTLVARLVSEHLLDELFLTVSPALFGRSAGDAKKALVDGVDFGRTPLGLSSVRRHESHLFLRYSLD
jgi:riboflavin biosynthesis pyrimidine reductase